MGRSVWKWMLAAIVVALVAMCLVGVLQAQTASTSIALSWVAPTRNTDGSTIATTNTLTYNLYQGVSGGAFTKVASGITGTTTVVTSTTAGLCFALTAVEAGTQTSVESALSSTSCALQPSSPSGLSISVTITVH